MPTNVCLVKFAAWNIQNILSRITIIQRKWRPVYLFIQNVELRLWGRQKETNREIGDYNACERMECKPRNSFLWIKVYFSNNIMKFCEDMHFPVTDSLPPTITKVPHTVQTLCSAHVHNQMIITCITLQLTWGQWHMWIVMMTRWSAPNEIVFRKYIDGNWSDVNVIRESKHLHFYLCAQTKISKYSVCRVIGCLISIIYTMNDIERYYKTLLIRDFSTSWKVVKLRWKSNLNWSLECIP